MGSGKGQTEMAVMVDCIPERGNSCWGTKEKRVHGNSRKRKSWKKSIVCMEK